MFTETTSEWRTCDYCNNLTVHLVEHDFVQDSKTKGLEVEHIRLHCSHCCAVTVAYFKWNPQMQEMEQTDLRPRCTSLDRGVVMIARSRCTSLDCGIVVFPKCG